VGRRKICVGEVFWGGWGKMGGGGGGVGMEPLKDHKILFWEQDLKLIFFPDGAKQNKPDKPFMKTTVVHLIPGSPFCFQRECHLLS